MSIVMTIIRHDKNLAGDLVVVTDADIHTHAEAQQQHIRLWWRWKFSLVYVDKLMTFYTMGFSLNVLNLFVFVFSRFSIFPLDLLLQS